VTFREKGRRNRLPFQLGMGHARREGPPELQSAPECPEGNSGPSSIDVSGSCETRCRSENLLRERVKFDAVVQDASILADSQRISEPSAHPRRLLEALSLPNAERGAIDMGRGVISSLQWCKET